MKKTERIGMVRRAVDDIERRKAEALATCEKNVRAAQVKLDELEAYRAAYVRDFTRRAESGKESNREREGAEGILGVNGDADIDGQYREQRAADGSIVAEHGDGYDGRERAQGASQAIGLPDGRGEGEG